MSRSQFYIFFFITPFFLTSCTSQIPKEMPKHTNDLIHETSPYLLQHAHNPVDWKPWNKETLELAKKENRSIPAQIKVFLKTLFGKK